MLIRYRNGKVVEAVLLSLRGGKLRVALRDSEDVSEFQLIKDVWVSEDGEPVTFDFTMSILAAAGIVPSEESRPAKTPSLSANLFPLSSVNLDRRN